MDWIGYWKRGKIGFDQANANAMMVRYFHTLSLKQNARIFAPLCGRSVDLLWLIDQGYEVVGVELYEPAVCALFDRLGTKPQISDTGSHLCYKSSLLTVYVGDFFKLDRSVLGSIDAIYDRAALVALTHPLRRRYAKKLIALAPKAKQFLITLRYDPPHSDNPPFSVDTQEIKELYDKHYRISLIEQSPFASTKRTNGFDLLYILEPKGDNADN